MPFIRKKASKKVSFNEHCLGGFAKANAKVNNFSLNPKKKNCFFKKNKQLFKLQLIPFLSFDYTIKSLWILMLQTKKTEFLNLERKDKHFLFLKKAANSIF